MQQVFENNINAIVNSSVSVSIHKHRVTLWLTFSRDFCKRSHSQM